MAFTPARCRAALEPRRAATGEASQNPRRRNRRQGGIARRRASVSFFVGEKGVLALACSSLFSSLCSIARAALAVEDESRRERRAECRFNPRLFLSLLLFALSATTRKTIQLPSAYFSTPTDPPTFLSFPTHIKKTTAPREGLFQLLLGVLSSRRRVPSFFLLPREQQHGKQCRRAHHLFVQEEAAPPPRGLVARPGARPLGRRRAPHADGRAARQRLPLPRPRGRGAVQVRGHRPVRAVELQREVAGPGTV